MNESLLNKTAYVGDEEYNGITYSKYTLYLNGREVMSIFTSKDEENFPVYIAKPFTDIETMIKTTHNAWLAGDGTRISSMAIKSVVYPNMPWLMADLYIPEN